METPYKKKCEWCGEEIWMVKIYKWGAYNERADGTISKITHAMTCKNSPFDKENVEFME